ncbi:hypothetical protein GH733_000473 [Mirounga leonina]|nr:hypothetical protein GH733_000473 [Mirounga leonina]
MWGCCSPWNGLITSSSTPSISSSDRGPYGSNIFMGISKGNFVHDQQDSPCVTPASLPGNNHGQQGTTGSRFKFRYRNMCFGFARRNLSEPESTDEMEMLQTHVVGSQDCNERKWGGRKRGRKEG